jgi:isopentenyl-diphosphate delta-isomerase
MAGVMDKYDEEQQKLMAEEVILLDENDKAIGSASKKDSHLMENIDKGMLHRAFSVFLFNSKNELCMQQRSAEKITFPLRWTNTCCSHPLHRDEERIEENQLGVKNAAIRKLEHELGIKVGQISADEIHFLTRIHYKAPCHGPWGEHEIDYVLFIKKDVELELVPNEVAAVKWVDADGLKAMIADADAGNSLFSPWCQMIAENFLYKWWLRLDEILAAGGLGDTEDGSAKKIHRVELKKEKHSGIEADAANNGK